MAQRAGKRLAESPDQEVPLNPEEVGGPDSPALFDASGDARVRILRKDDKTQKLITHGFMPKEVKEEDVAIAFGGGHYRAQLLIPNELGQEVIKRSRDFFVPGAYKPPMEIAGIRETRPAPTGSPVPQQVSTMPGVGSDMSQVLNATVMTTFIDLIKTMKEVTTKPAPTTDPMLLELLRGQSAMQGKIVELLLPLITGGNQNRGDGRKEILELIVQLKDVLAPAQPVVNPSDPNAVLTGIVSAIKQLREVSDELSPERNTGTGDPMLDAFPKVVEILAEEQSLRKKQLEQTPKPRAAVRAPQTPTLPAGTGTEEQPVVQSDIPMWRRLMQGEGPRLVAAAQKGQDPELIAKMAVTFAPDNIKGVIVEFFHRPIEEVVAQMVEEVPALREYPAWVNEFTETVQFLLFPDEFDEEGEDEVPEPEPAGGNSGTST